MITHRKIWFGANQFLLHWKADVFDDCAAINSHINYRNNFKLRVLQAYTFIHNPHDFLKITYTKPLQKF